MSKASRPLPRERSSPRPAPRRVHLSIALLLVLAALVPLLPPGRAAAQPTQAGFEDEKVLDAAQPTALTFTPDGRMLVTTKAGRVLVKREGAPQTLALDISAKVCPNYERGLLGVAVDADFATNGYVFLYYTFKKYPDCGRDAGRLPVNRVSRFVMRDDAIDPRSEKILIDNVPSRHGNHNAGDLEVGKDGFLYVSIGDSGGDLDNASSTGPENNNARQPHLLLGKIARITRDGGIPRTNPYTDPATSARCALSGRTTPGKRCQETFASGLRNPFRFAFDPNAAGTRFVINDVGQYTYEEIDEGRKGADYGWNVREGFCVTSTANCSPAETVGGYSNPILHYTHGTGCSSITGGAFVPDGVWPAEYDGNYLFADYVCGGIFRLAPGASGKLARVGNHPVSQPFVANNNGSPVHLRFGPAPGGQALYYTTFVGGGQIRRVVHTGSANRAPIARASAAPTQGREPLTVTFDGTMSGDPDEADRDKLTFAWDFGDGQTGDRPTLDHTYTDAGQYAATLTVTDPAGRSDRTTIDIDVGNQLPCAVIDTPAMDKLFAVGERITLRGHAEDAAGNRLDGATLEWQVLQHHNTHAHPYLEETGNDIAFEAPAPEDLEAATNSYLEIRLTVVGADGRRSRVARQELEPDKIDVRFQTLPGGLRLNVNGNPITGPATVTSWRDWELRVEAPSQTIEQDGQRQGYEWVSWDDDPDARSSRTIRTSQSGASYTATFRAVSLFAPVADAQVLQGRPNANFGRVGSLSVVGGRQRRAESLLRFQVQGLTGQVQQATLRLYVPDAARVGTANGPAVVLTNNRWAERTVDWNNRPAKVGAAVDDLGAIQPGGWVELDVTRLINGDGVYNFALVSSSPDNVVFASRETGNAPQLTVVSGTGLSPSAEENPDQPRSGAASGTLPA